MMLFVLQDAGGLTEMLTRTAEPWSKLYSHNKAVSAGVLFLHLAPLIFAAGTAFVADRVTIRVADSVGERGEHLASLGKAHRIVVGGLVLSVISGLLLFFADVETFLPSIYFWIKLGCVALLLINGFILTLTEKALARAGDDAALWGRMRTLAFISAFLWLATTLAGVVLKEFA